MGNTRASVYRRATALLQRATTPSSVACIDTVAAPGAALRDCNIRRAFTFLMNEDGRGWWSNQLGPSSELRRLALDRTNRDFGKTTINILMISVAWNGSTLSAVAPFDQCLPCRPR
jgi:hypothetical protein